MKIIKLFPAAIMLCFISCGDKEDDNPKPINNDPVFEGRWDLVNKISKHYDASGNLKQTDTLVFEQNDYLIFGDGIVKEYDRGVQVSSMSYTKKDSVLTFSFGTSIQKKHIVTLEQAKLITHDTLKRADSTWVSAIVNYKR